MSTLDVGRAYVLAGSSSRDGEAGGSSTSTQPPRVLQLRLSSEALAKIIAEGSSSVSDGIAIVQPQGRDTRLIVGLEEYHVHSAEETGVHHLYHLSSSNADNIDNIGTVSAKLTIRHDATASSTATSRLKESRDAEQARKQGSRTVLLQGAPSSQKPVPGKSSSLKLRPKALAATSSPLMRSRAATPATNAEEFRSHPGSPEAAFTTAETNADKRARLNAGGRESIEIKRQILQLLASGPLQRRQIVQELPFSEAQIAPVLESVATTPGELQAPSKDPAASRHEGSMSRHDVSGPMQTNPSTMYALSDESYRQVLVKDWRAYSPGTKVVVSKLMAAALDRLGVEPYAVERAQITPLSRKLAESISQERLDDISDAELSAAEPQTSSPEKPMSKSKPSRKPTTQDRLKRAAKGKTLVSSSRRQTESPSLAATSTRPEGGTATRTTTGTASTPTVDPIASGAESEIDMQKQKAGVLTLKKRSALGPDHAAAKAQVRRNCEYTDSSDGEDSSIDELPKQRDSHRTTSRDDHASTRSSSQPSRSVERHGVGRGATSQSEPWLDVKSARDWHELARRFQRIYADYQHDRRKLQSEEELLRAELVCAKEEEAQNEERAAAAKRLADSSHLAPSKAEAGGRQAPPDDDEREEGEASPSVEKAPPSFADWRNEDVDENAVVTWRHTAVPHPRAASSRKVGSTSIASSREGAQQTSLSSGSSAMASPGKSANDFGSGPMSLEEMDLLVASIVNREEQLKRMRAVLQSSKSRLARSEQQHGRQHSRAIAV